MFPLFVTGIISVNICGHRFCKSFTIYLVTKCKHETLQNPNIEKKQRLMVTHICRCTVTGQKNCDVQGQS